MGRLSDDFTLIIPGTEPTVFAPCDPSLDMEDDPVAAAWAGPYSVSGKYIVGQNVNGRSIIDPAVDFSVSWLLPPIQDIGAPTADVTPDAPNINTDDLCAEQDLTVAGTMPDAPSTVPTEDSNFIGTIRMAAR